MADVQLKNGYIRIASKLFEQFFIRDFSPIQLRILLLLIRVSYGCHKKTAKIKPQNLFNTAYVYESDIKRELKHLERNKVIVCNFEEKIFALNKNFDEWKIPFHKLFDEEKFSKLLRVNLLSCGLSENLVDNEDLNEEENEPLLPTKQTLSCGLSENLVDNEETQPENTGSDEGLTPSINILNNSKDNNNIYINNNKPQDPYFGNVTTEFKKQYQLIFKKQCYLNNFQLQKLAEIPVTVPNFKELIPVLLQKFSKISFNFDGEVKKPGLRWLLEEGNWADVLSGKFDNEKQPESEAESEQCWSLEEAMQRAEKQRNNNIGDDTWI